MLAYEATRKRTSCCSGDCLADPVRLSCCGGDNDGCGVAAAPAWYGVVLSIAARATYRRCSEGLRLRYRLYITGDSRCSVGGISLRQLPRQVFDFERTQLMHRLRVQHHSLCTIHSEAWQVAVLILLPRS